MKNLGVPDMSSRPWLDAYPPSVPVEIDASQYRSLVELMAESFQRFSDRVAYSYMLSLIHI